MNISSNEAVMEQDIKFGVVIPTRNAGNEFYKLLKQINAQSIQPARKLVIDTTSTDKTQEYAQMYGFELLIVKASEFGHGRTRQQAFVSLAADVDFVMYMTQDIEIADQDTFHRILSAFSDPKVGAAYGRQLPRSNATEEAKVLRLFNYPEKSNVVSIEDKDKYGIKAAFLSDSYAAYRVSALQDVGGFPQHVKICEDMYIGGKMLLRNWKLAYVAEAEVIHSHNFSLWEHMQRYYAIGKFHGKERWLLEEFGKSEAEGKKLIMKQMKEAMGRGNIVSAFGTGIRAIAKYVAYVLGKGI